MQHPLRQARPADPFLRLRLDDADIGDYVVEGDHVAVLCAGRRSGEVWVTALGDDEGRILSLIDRLRVNDIDGVTVHDHVYAALPDDLRGPDPGHWSLWELAGPVAEIGDTVDLGAGDARIDDLLRHSESAYIHTGDPQVLEWHGVTESDRLVAVGARVQGAGGSAHLVSICTDPAYRGRGLARRVTASLAASALATGSSGVWLEMYADNAAAARAYRAVGFVESGRYRSALRAGRSAAPREDDA